jgi:hypothetical protein
MFGSGGGLSFLKRDLKPPLILSTKLFLRLRSGRKSGVEGLPIVRAGCGGEKKGVEAQYGSRARGGECSMRALALGGLEVSDWSIARSTSLAVKRLGVRDCGREGH